jgi:YggT family protein
MLLRLIFNYTDPNPFGKIGRFSHWLKKKTDNLVRPAAFFLARFNASTKLAPLLPLGLSLILGYFTLSFGWRFLFAFKGIADSLASGKFPALLGFILSVIITFIIFCVIFRIIFSYFLDYSHKVLKFFTVITDPIMLPFQRLIPPIGYVDISPIVVLLVLNILQIFVERSLIG